MRPGFWKSGDPFIWVTGSALGCCLLMVAGLVGVIGFNALGHFWPAPLVRLDLADGSRVMGRETARQEIPGTPGAWRVQLKVGNRDTYGLDFRWVDEAQVTGRELPAGALVLERQEWGELYGELVGLREGDHPLAGEGEAGWAELKRLMGLTGEERERIRELERGELSDLTRQEKELRALGDEAPGAEQERLQARFEALAEELGRLRGESERYVASLRLAGGEERQVKVVEILRAYRPNQMGWPAKAGVYLSRSWEFLTGEPRESNTEGGIFPALYGTVLMVVLMSLAAVPFGVVAALYLREYAGQGPLVQAIRVAVNNLAGVPSIVFGMFGLGFFVYGVGGTIDQVFFSEALPSPTFGTGGILWASMTLALLTVPVVIVATEEGLAAVPRELREGSLALGSTKLQMIWRLVLPSALPGILTGVILATARGAGEVAPLMITGVVKLAPDLPLDGVWPFFHLERKFMHLGFHIYDVGFQSPNVEAARPMVFTTTLLLLGIVLALNLIAIAARNRLRRRYASSAF
ncbi:MAG: phosphate ABC transporter permease PstA [Candidatus Handelsmanbacteria bacterium]|nr:phosphate ABC transporter permease PstA [Candidatus Handelsmanbacteria bacterium]